MSAPLSAGPSKRRGQYSSRACNECRRRRCKCDGVQPTCETCRIHNRECNWSAEMDARRPSTKQMVESLRTKIQSLEAELERLRVATNPTMQNNPPVDPEPPNNFAGLSEVPSLDQLNISRRNRNIWETNTSFDLDDISNTTPLSTSGTHLIATVKYQYIFQIDNSLPPHEQPKDIQLSLVCDWSRYLPRFPDVPFSRLEHDTLLLRCFKYGTSWLMGLVPELFLHDMLYSLTSIGSESLPQARLQHYSPMLHCSVMAFATAFSDNPTIRAPATRARFASWAKQWLDKEFENPAMSLIRSMALLAEYHCGVGEKDAGYMFMGMSFQAVRFFIGRNDRDITPNEGVITFPESINRSWHFWSAFGYDKLMAIDFGFEYEVHIPRSGISHPLVDDELDNQPWLLESPLTSLTDIPYANLITVTFYESCKLMIITTEIIDTVHRRKKQALEERIVIDTHLRLDTWFNELPDKLTIRANSASPLPHVIMLHICYWWLLVILHQPSSQNVSTEVEAKPPSIEGLSTKIRDRAGHKIVQLLKMFDRQHGLRFFPRNMIEAICACGTALLWEYTSTSAAAQKKRSNAIDGVSTCVTALRTISVTWPYAQTRADHLERRLQKHFPPEFIMTQVDDPSLNPSRNLLEEQGLDDFTDISSELQQYMNGWHVLPFEVSQSSGLSSEMFGPEPSNHQE